MRWCLDTMGCLASRKRTHALGFRTRLSQDSGEVRFDVGNYVDSEFHRLPCANAFAPRVKLTVLQQAQLQAGVLRTAMKFQDAPRTPERKTQSSKTPNGMPTLPFTNSAFCKGSL